MSIKIIELRQKDAINIVQNGVYDSTLNEDVIEINEGDEISIKSVFIDTTEQNSFVFPNDVNLEIEFGFYMTDWRENDEKIPSEGLEGVNTGELYIPYKAVLGNQLDPAVFELITSIDYNVSVGSNQTNTITYSYTYIDYDNNSQTLIRSYPVGSNQGFSPFQNDTNQIQVYKDAIRILTRKGTFQATANTLQLMAKNLEANDFFRLETQAPTIDTYAPYIMTASLVFPKGIYSPSELSNKLSETLTNNSISPRLNKQNASLNNFLRPTKIFDLNQPSPDGDGVIIEQVEFYNLDLTNKFTYTLGSNEFIGASQIDFNYDDVSNKFQILFMHTPMYDDDSGLNISVYYLRKNYSADGAVYTCGKHSGIYFNSLKSFDSVSGQQTTFFEDLGFDLNLLCVQPTTIEDEILNKTGLFTKYNLLNGLNMTDAFVGNDSLIVKGKDTWYALQNISDKVDANISTSEATITIDAQLTLPQVAVPFSHYLIELSLGLKNSYVDGITSYSNISSIVSRYYSYGSYTSDGGEGSISYIHKGSPLYFRSAKTRILTSSKIPDPKIGPDNTIMVQITKSS
jgi:hypothetical protein